MCITKTVSFSFLIFVLGAIGCGKQQPIPITNAQITIEGKPNEVVVYSVKAMVVKIDGNSSNVRSVGNYGPKELDSDGKLVINVNELLESEPLHGFLATVVNLDSEPVKLTMSADGQKTQTAETEGKLTYAHLQMGYKKENQPGSLSTYTPEDTVYEAREYLKSEESPTSEVLD